MTLVAGTRLGPYEVVSPLGAGGMGEVYKAKDTRLGRTVAVKVLPQHLSASAEVRQRFEREAKTVSQLSHPHICALYDVGREGETEYLVMELLEGETLSERLGKGPLPLEQVLRFGQEIADALDKAHRQGIVHRDLKPANVMLTKSGVKLLDFGLAKAMAPEAAKGSLTSLPTQQGLTQEGTILGTFQYMAPEQLEGKEADARTDVFSLGATLYEMATGKKAFSASSQASLITAIMSSDPPPISSAVPMSPPALDHVVKACLAKDPEDRWQSAADIDRELRWIREQSGAAERPSVEKRRGRSFLPWIGWAAAAVLAAALLSARRQSAAPPPASPGPLRFSLELPNERLPIPSADGTNPIVLLPKGRGLVFCAVKGASTELKHLDLATGQIRSIPGTVGATSPFVSPDGRWIGFNVSDTLRKVAVEGGTPFDISPGAVPRGAWWGTDGSIYFTPRLYGGISRVSSEGGQAQAVTQLEAGERTERWPETLPGGRALVFASLVHNARSWDDAEIVLKRLDTGERRVLVRGGTTPHFLPSGHLVYARAGSLFAVPFDLETLTIKGAAAEVARDVYVETTGDAFATFADTGLFVYAAASAVQVNRVLTRVDRGGRGERLTDRAEAYVQFSLSPDGTRLVSDFDNSMWVFDIRRQSFTHLPAAFRLNAPTWAPDGKRLVYSSEKNGPWNIFWRAADGAGEEHDLLVGPKAQVPIDVSRDGRWLLVQGGENFDELDVLPLSDLSPAGPPRKVSAGRALLGALSPDGRWVVHGAPESGRLEIVVVPTEGGEGRWQISTAGGNLPRWSPRGDEIFYLEGEKLMAVPVSAGPRFEAGTPHTLFSKPDLRVFSVEPDAQHFILAELPSPLSGNLAVIENWFAQVVARSAEAQKK
ncbi:MAG TPA: protein kinase [Thermoanaerobaculia bacterium]|nr:protein kinase [Thermoanaerobaculia bacterium]